MNIALTAGIALATAVLGAFCGALWMHYKDEERIAALAAHSERLRIERDGLRAVDGQSQAALDEATRRLKTLTGERDGARAACDVMTTKLAQSRAQIADRDEEIQRLRTQLSEVVYEVKPNIAVDVATEPPKIVRYEVKTPRTRKAKTVTQE